MKYRLIFIFLLSCLWTLSAQDTLTLEHCLIQARENAPRSADITLIKEGGELRRQNAGVNWLPSMTLNGKATWQSDVVELNFENTPFPIELPEIPHDQYGLALDVRQMLYDGGLTKKLKVLESANEQLDLQQVEVDLFRLKDQVSQLFFTLLILQENRENLQLTMENLKVQEKVLEGGLENGIFTRNDLSVMQVEILRLLQALTELDMKRDAILESLSILTGEQLSSSSVIKAPYLELNGEIQPERPEQLLFGMQKQMMDASLALKKTERLPKLFAFGQAGYGRPGYNMLSNEFSTYYMAGITFQWALWDWKKNNRELQLLEQKKEMIGHAEESFIRQINILTTQELHNVEQYRKALELDEHILSLQKEVTVNAASQLENGIINSSAFLIEQNKESAARISSSLHRIRMKQAMANILIINGKI